MASENTQYVVRQQGSPLEVKITPKPTAVESTEVMIRLKAVAINPADCKMIYEGHRISSWPLVAGLDGAGVVEAVGDNVKSFAVGDEVLALFTVGERSGSFQKFAVVQEGKVAKKPATWSFEEAATMGVCYMTAITGLGMGLKSPLPFLKDGPAEGFTPSSVVVLGGSSALGAATTQLLRLAVPSCKIIATASLKHHSRITDILGADEAIDRSSESLVTDVKAATTDSRGVDAIFDAVGAAESQMHVFESLDPSGPKRYAQVWTGGDEIQTPSGVDSIMFRGRDLPQLQGGINIMSALQTLLEEKNYSLPLPVKIVGEELEGLKKGLALMREGVSGEKLVVLFK